MNSENEKFEQGLGEDNVTDSVDMTQIEDAMENFESADDYMVAAETLSEDVQENVAVSDSMEDVMAEESSYDAYISEEDSSEKSSVEVEEVVLETEAVDPMEPVQEEPATEEKEELDRSDIVAEFAPAPIKIPNYNREKEQRRAKKETVKNEKKNSRKRQERHEKLYRFVFVARTILLFVLMASVATGMLFSLLVKMSTSKYSIERTISNNNPGRFIVGKIPDAAREELKLAESSPRASLMDIIRDNKLSDRTVTYYDIEHHISKSSYPKFISGIASDIIDYYLFGDKYEGVTEEEIAALIESSAGRIETLTGQSVGATASQSLAKYIKDSNAFKEISSEAVEAQKINHDTQTTSFLFSTMMLILLVVAMLLMIILALVACKGFAHKMIGWSIMIAGLIVGIVGYFVDPLFVSSNEFVKCVIDVLITGFNKSALIWGGISALLGIVVIVLGKAMRENEDDDDLLDDEDLLSEDEYYEEMDEDDYIDEIEQVSTAH